ncbi:MAG: thioredoxin-dependent thiol peroxidase [Chloroflexi bacterium]|nr:thioredoxin-dependent thiol peroxidase [Chloroflexota bacterium]PWB42555.1 MAG: thioredoxin-dependent thiol peroxidase [Dehalococcoidia bacterium]
MVFPVIGSAAPEFSLSDQDGTEVTLGSLRGRWAVFYFYPKDDTPGCTKEACNFRDNHAAIQAAGATVLGVSGDTAAAHRKFAEKHSLPFQLLVDEGNGVARAFGAWGTKNMYGKTYEGIIRSTFVINPDGKIAKVWPKVKPDAHGAEVLAWLKEHAS